MKMKKTTCEHQNMFPASHFLFQDLSTLWTTLIHLVLSIVNLTAVSNVNLVTD